MHVSELTVKRPVLASVISLFLILIGIISYDKLTIREYPDIDKPVITVSTIYRGASAEIMERDVTQVLEDSISGISDIKEIKSDSKNEFSSIKIEFNLNRDMDSAANDVREKVSRVSSLLPKESNQVMHDNKLTINLITSTNAIHRNIKVGGDHLSRLPRHTLKK